MVELPNIELRARLLSKLIFIGNSTSEKRADSEIEVTTEEGISREEEEEGEEKTEE